MYSIETKSNENYLILTLKGYIPHNSFFQLSDELLQKAATLRPGFGVITDMREWEKCDPETVVEFSVLMKKTVELGMKSVVRVIQSASQEVLAPFQKANIQAGYFTRYFMKLEDAEKYLLNTLNS
ncbi:MAG: hypothetical protein JW737_03165 [Acidobacteria bacterium]|nr:hypothetical protein [Acidobacteriota bacterium]